MLMIVAYGMWGQDNGAYYFREAPDEVFCPDCGSVIDRDYTPRTLGRVNPSTMSRPPMTITVSYR